MPRPRAAPAAAVADPVVDLAELGALLKDLNTEAASVVRFDPR